MDDYVVDIVSSFLLFSFIAVCKKITQEVIEWIVMKLDMFCDTKRLIRGRTEFNETHQKKNVVLNTFSLEFLYKICKFFTWILNKFFFVNSATWENLFWIKNLKFLNLITEIRISHIKIFQLQLENIDLTSHKSQWTHRQKSRLKNYIYTLLHRIVVIANNGDENSKSVIHSFFLLSSYSTSI
jgi:hypothetical protein